MEEKIDILLQQNRRWHRSRGVKLRSAQEVAEEDRQDSLDDD